MTQTQMARAPRRTGAVALMIAALIGIYMISQFFRNSIGVIGPDLARDFDLRAGDLSWLSSIFFFAFAAAQIPVGVAIDRFGPRAVILATAAITLVGAAVFAFAPNYAGLLAGRALLGLGCSSFYMGSLSIYAREFPPARFGQLTGMQLGAGTIGTLVATAPLAWAAQAWGWRGAFWAVAGVSAAMTLFVLLFVHESDHARALRSARAESLSDSLKGVARAVRVPEFWSVFYMQVVTYSPFAAVLGLWAAPWLAQVYGVGPEERGRLLFALALGQVAGLFFWGALDRPMRSYKRPALISLAGAIACLSLAAFTEIPRGWLMAFLALFGLFNAASPLITAHGKSLFPAELTARGLTLMNIGTVGGVWAQQFLTGLVMDLFPYTQGPAGRIYPSEAYHAVFAVMAAELALGVLIYLRVRDRHPMRTSDAPK
jgi:predicted MFS family arabinose efflux permease